MSTIQIVNFRWPQGEDLNIQLIYREGETPAKAVPVPLNSGYSIRMDLVVPTTRNALYSFTAGSGDGVLGSGANDEPNINIFLDRDLTLPGGALFPLMKDGVNSFPYDLFIRNIASDRQVKVLRGNIAVEMSNTLWA